LVEFNNVITPNPTKRGIHMLNLEGQILKNRYRIDALVGRGGMAEVYQAWDTWRNYHVAIKLMREDLAEDAEFVQRFKREATALAQLAHDNIVRFYSFEREDLLAFIVMDYIEGTTLRSEIARAGGPLDLQRSLAIMESVCGALHYAHMEGVIHRDIKPGNIMIRPDGRVLVADFGIAKAADAATATTVMPGTPAYMSPEQCRSEVLDARTDVYSLGVVLYEMLAGQRPFVGDSEVPDTGSTREKIRWEQMNADPPSLQALNPVVSSELEATVFKAMAKEPDDRWPSALAFWHGIQQAAGIEAVATPVVAETPPSPVATPAVAEPTPPPPAEPPPAPITPPPAKPRTTVAVTVAAVAAIAVVLLVLCAGLGWLLWSRGDSDTTGSDAGPDVVAMDTDTPVPTPTDTSVSPTATPKPTRKPISTPEPAVNTGRIAFASKRNGNFEIYVMQADGSGMTNLTQNEAFDVVPAWSPDGSQIVFSSDRDDNFEIYVMQADGSGMTNLTQNEAFDADPAWSPDGSQIAFSSDRDDDFEIYVMQTDGSGLTRLTHQGGGEPDWSPNGSQITFVNGRDDDYEIYVMQTDGSGVTRLTDQGGGKPDWSPNGSQIAFNSERDGNMEIYVMQADGSDQTRLTDNETVDWGATWSPDGSQIAFVSYRDGNAEIYVMMADGSDLTRLTHNEADDWFPTWSPW
jgi:serine/threonine protein kinase